jgi:hypothetical protein
MHQYNGGDDTTLPHLWIGRAGGGRRLAAATCSPWPHELRCFLHCLLLSDGRDQDPDRREELLAGSPLSIRSLAPLFLSLRSTTGPALLWQPLPPRRSRSPPGGWDGARACGTAATSSAAERNGPVVFAVPRCRGKIGKCGR